MENNSPYPIQSNNAAPTPDVNSAIQQLLDMLGPARLIDLVEKLSDVARDPGFGDIVMVVMDSRVRLIKASKSYDWSRY